MLLLALVNGPVSGQLLRSVADDLPGDADVLVIAPATTRPGLRFWVSDVDDAIAHADEVQTETVERLAEAGIDRAPQPRARRARLPRGSRPRRDDPGAVRAPGRRRHGRSMELLVDAGVVGGSATRFEGS